MDESTPCAGCPTVIAGDARSPFCSRACYYRNWRRLNAAKVKADKAAWYAANRDLTIARACARYQADPEKHKAKTRRSRQENPQIDAKYQARRHAQKTAPGSERIYRRVVWRRDGGLCWLCGQPIDPTLKAPDKRSQTLDHKIPLSRGGAHTYENVALAHLDCNMRKGMKIVTGAVANTQ